MAGKSVGGHEPRGSGRPGLLTMAVPAYPWLRPAGRQPPGRRRGQPASAPPATERGAAGCTQAARQLLLPVRQCLVSTGCHCFAAPPLLAQAGTAAAAGAAAAAGLQAPRASGTAEGMQSLSPSPSLAAAAAAGLQQPAASPPAWQRQPRWSGGWPHEAPLALALLPLLARWRAGEAPVSAAAAMVAGKPAAAAAGVVPGWASPAGPPATA